MKKIKIKVFSNGYVQAETQGIKGQKCEKYFPLFEKILQDRVVEKMYTEEFYEEVEQEQTISEEELIINAGINH